jgi:hypothetical protein
MSQPYVGAAWRRSGPITTQGVGLMKTAGDLLLLTPTLLD